MIKFYTCDLMFVKGTLKKEGILLTLAVLPFVWIISSSLFFQYVI